MPDRSPKRKSITVILIGTSQLRAYKKTKEEKMENKRVRICDIAEELGLSTATVSNVIHGKTKKVSEETIRRVQALLEQRKYIPSMAGILLAQNNSRIIGIIINNHEKYEGCVLEDVFIASSLNYLSAEIEKAEQFMMVKVTNMPEEIVRFASMWNLDGMVLIGFCEQDYRKLREFMHIPFVIYDGFLDSTEGMCNLVIDNYDGGLQVGQHFKKKGYRKALCIADNEICMDLERLQGFQKGFGEGADFLKIPMHRGERRAFYARSLERIREYRAVFAVSDYYAVDLMQFLMEKEIRIPEDMAVAGFDDNPICMQLAPTLTSVRQDGQMRAQIAIAKIRELKEGTEKGTTIKLPVHLVERASTQTKRK